MPVGTDVFTDSETTVGSMAIYSCQEGYSMDNTNETQIRTCGTNGTWEGTPPTCEPVSKC